MNTAEILHAAATVLLGERRGSVAFRLLPGLSRVVLTVYAAPAFADEVDVPLSEWLAALQNTATAKRWAVAAVNGVLSEALNSGDGVYRP